MTQRLILMLLALSFNIYADPTNSTTTTDITECKSEDGTVKGDMLTAITNAYDALDTKNCPSYGVLISNFKEKIIYLGGLLGSNQLTLEQANSICTSLQTVYAATQKNMLYTSTEQAPISTSDFKNKCFTEYQNIVQKQQEAEWKRILPNQGAMGILNKFIEPTTYINPTTYAPNMSGFSPYSNTGNLSPFYNNNLFNAGIDGGQILGNSIFNSIGGSKINGTTTGANQGTNQGSPYQYTP